MGVLDCIWCPGVSWGVVWGTLHLSFAPLPFMLKDLQLSSALHQLPSAHQLSSARQLSSAANRQPRGPMALLVEATKPLKMHGAVWCYLEPKDVWMKLVVPQGTNEAHPEGFEISEITAAAIKNTNAFPDQQIFVFKAIGHKDKPPEKGAFMLSESVVFTQYVFLSTEGPVVADDPEEAAGNDVVWVPGEEEDPNVMIAVWIQDFKKFLPLKLPKLKNQDGQTAPLDAGMVKKFICTTLCIHKRTQSVIDMRLFPANHLGRPTGAQLQDDVQIKGRWLRAILDPDLELSRQSEIDDIDEGFQKVGQTP